MSPEILSPVIVCAGALLIILLERRFPYTPGQEFLREGFWTDLTLYAIAQSYVLSWVIYAIIHHIDAATHLTRLRIVTDWPLWLQCLFFLVTHDLYIYLFHRLQHHNSVLWRIHEAHHSVKDVDWLAGARSHSLEILINQTVEFAPIVLLGASPAVALFKGVIDAVWGMYIHSNIDVKSGWLQYFINGPEMHRWHHAIEIRSGGVNFSTKLAFWDWIFGTAHLPRPAKPSGFGLDDPNYPSGYVAQHVYAFREFSDG
ncbi:MAG TPA: sterol desaturase family protein [Bacteroidota bacterium]|nr:sterol desaturase family protein [Bacteroidota bacterium]